ncbi:putative non-specific serine/threonine protein kinase [Helianthus anomalus]
MEREFEILNHQSFKVFFFFFFFFFFLLQFRIISSQNISTSLPTEFTKLQHLQLLDLRFNYLRGSIPSEWATMRLSNLSLMGRRLSGRFPTTLTRMTTLLEL